ncbi:MAG: hypothetical protein GY790_17300 [Bacteroidetes bacterium]|nr:hypothetical protein [Bacteroidota bacterium]
MNDLKLDYSKKGGNSPQLKRLLLIAGVVLIGLSLATMVMVISQNLKIILLVAAIANAGVGVGFLLQSQEHKIMYPKKYIHISTESIEFKLGGWYKEQKIGWDSISRFSDEGKSIHIHSGDRVYKINMLHFPSSDEKRIRAAIKAIAELKQG